MFSRNKILWLSGIPTASLFPSGQWRGKQSIDRDNTLVNIRIFVDRKINGHFVAGLLSLRCALLGVRLDVVIVDALTLDRGLWKLMLDGSWETRRVFRLWSTRDDMKLLECFYNVSVLARIVLQICSTFGTIVELEYSKGLRRAINILDTGCLVRHLAACASTVWALAILRFKKWTFRLRNTMRFSLTFQCFFVDLSANAFTHEFVPGLLCHHNWRWGSIDLDLDCPNFRNTLNFCLDVYRLTIVRCCKISLVMAATPHMISLTDV